jgi:uncharacterized repeat protein (TIGR01451 family)
MLFTFYVPRLDATNAPVLNATTGDDLIDENNASLSVFWDPIDPRDPATTALIDAPGPEHQLEEQSIAIQKSAAVFPVLPDQTIIYTLDVQISDFFAFDTVVISDTFSDGQRFDTSFVPTLQVDGNSFTLASADFAATNYTVSQNFSGATATPPVFTVDPAGNDGTTTVTFRVSDEILLREPTSLGRMIGGCVDAGGGGLVTPCDPINGTGDGPTTAQIIFRTIIQDEYTDDFPSGDASVDQGDVLNNNVTISGDVLNNVGLTPTGESEDDDSAAMIEIERGELEKSIYAINGTVDTYANAVEVAPDDTVTYRLRYELPSSDVENLTLTDYLPLPVFDVDSTANITTFDLTVSAAAPPAGIAKYGPDDTFNALPGTPDPTLSRDSVANSITFSYGDYDNASNVPSVIDILFTVTVGNDPFADQLLLTNQVRQTEESTQQVAEFADSIIQVTLTEPFLRVSKGAIGENSPTGVLTATAGPVAFTAPGSAGNRFTGTIGSTALETTPIDANVSGVDAGDLVSFAIMIENTGSSRKGAFDVTITDTLPLGFVIPTSGAGLNLNITRGDGVVVPFTGLGGGAAGADDDLFFNGIELTDPSAALGACQEYHPSNGSNIIIITYDLQVGDTVKPGDIITNITNVTNYAGTDGGPNHVPDPRSQPTDDADTLITAPLTKSIRTTSESSTVETGTGTNVNPRLLAIGEIVRYRLQVQLPEGVAPDLQLHDILPNGLTFLNDGTAAVAFVSNSGVITSTTLSGAGLNQTGNQTTTVTITPTFVLPDDAVSSSPTANVDTYNEGSDVYFNLGTLGNPDRDGDNEFVLIEFNVLLNNVNGNQIGTNRDNSFALRIESTPIITSTAVRVRAVEPNIGLAKLVAPTSADAGDTVTYSVFITNTAGLNVSSAFDLVLTDTLPSDLTLIPASVTTTPAGGATGITPIQAGNSITVTIDTLPPGGSVRVDYQATVNLTVSPGQLLVNTARARFTSLPGTGTSSNPTGSNTPGASGANNGERNGDASAGAQNDYRVSDNATLQVFVPAPVKTLVTTSEAHTTGSNVAIGEIVRYRLAVRLAEATITNFQLRENLPTGISFVNDGTTTFAFVSDNGGGSGIQSNVTTINACADVATAPATLPCAFPAAQLDAATVTFSFGTLINNDTDINEESVLLEFNALVQNVAGNQAGTVLNNTFSALVNGSVVSTSPALPVTVVEPALTIGKTVGAAPPVAGDLITYTITINNAAGAATAFNLAVNDVLDSNLTLSSVTTISAPGYTSFINTSSGTTASGTISELRAGDSVILQIVADVSSAIAGSLIIPNSANLSYTSLPGPNGTTTNPTGSANTGTPGSSTGERIGTTGVNDYTSTGSVSLALGSLGDFIWYDANGDGVQDAGENGIAGVTVRLTWPGPDGDFATTADNTTTIDVTDANGVYGFTGLIAATYRVAVDTATLPAGLTISGDPDGGALSSSFDATLSATQQRLDIDFGYVGTGSLGDFVWYDVNDDGVQDPAEEGIAGVELTLTWAGRDNIFGSADDFTYPADTTDANGLYGFTQLPAGSFRVQVTTATLPGSMVQTYDLDGAGASPDRADATLGSGATRSDVDFGYRGTLALGDYVWFDTNNDGLQGSGEEGIANVVLELVWAGPNAVFGDADDIAVGTATTDANGIYSFTNLPSGQHRVTVNTTTLPGGVTQTYDLDGLGTANQATATLTNADLNTVDFGYVGALSLGDTVWYDPNDNGVQDPGEPGLSGVDVTLIWYGPDAIFGTPDDVSFGTQTTDTSGNYSFTNLPNGTFRVSVDSSDLPSGFAPSYDLDGSGTPHITAITLSGSSRNDADFGYIGTGSLGDFVWFDANNNAAQDPGEPGIAAVDVTLRWAGQDATFNTADDAVLQTTTDSSGGYLFDQLPAGQYLISIDSADLPTAVVQTYDLDGLGSANSADRTLGSGEDATDVDFGYVGTLSIGDFVWQDQDTDGVQDGGEPGIANVTVTMLWFGPDGTEGTTDDVSYSDVTDGSGIYGVNNLAAGAYRVSVDISTLPSGFNPTYDVDGILTPSTALVTLTASRLDLDFGYDDSAPPATGALGDRVWLDTNGNGVQDVGESGINGVTINLVFAGPDGLFGTADDEASTAPQLTSGDGNYQFTNLPAGLYRVVIDGSSVPSGLSASYELDGVLNGTTEVALAAGQTRSDVDFGFTSANAGATTGELGDFVWLDGGGDGVQGPTEPGIANVPVTLTGAGPDGLFGTADDTTATTTTDADGFYLFTALPTGRYQVTVDSASPTLSGFLPTYELDSVLDNTVEVQLTVGQRRYDVDFGFLNDGVIPPSGALGDRVWLDIDDDGVQDAGEPGLSGVTINIIYYGSDGLFNTADDVVYSVLTGANGIYNVGNLAAGTYVVSVDTASLPAGLSPTFDLDGGDDSRATAALTSGQVRIDVDFGYVGRGSIGDRVWNDADADRIQDASEVGIPNVDVTLTWAGLDGVFGTSDDYTATTTTDANGIYSFDGLPSGDYRVTVDDTSLPGGLNQTYELDGSLDNSTIVALGLGQNRIDVDFGYTALAFGPLGGIGDYVWLDRNADGVQDLGEPGLPGVTVILIGDGADNTFGTADDVTFVQQTDANGGYNFTGLIADTYRVSIDIGSLPPGLTNTFDRDGTPNSSTDVVLGAGDVITDADFGYVGDASLGDRIWNDTDGDGVQDVGENGFNGVAVILTWAGVDGVLGSADDETFTTTTSGDGDYLFDGLPAGAYRVTVDVTTLPPDVVPTYDLDGGSDSLTDVGLTIGQDRVDVDFGYVVPVIDLTITKTSVSTVTAPGGLIVYTLTYTNFGNVDATGVTITETVPLNTTFDAASSTSGWSCTAGAPGGTNCTFAVGTLARTASATVTFAVRVLNPVPSGVDQISNTASITDDGSRGPDPTPPNNSDDEITPLDAAPDLTITKDDGENVVLAGDTLTYTLVIANVGNQNATGVLVEDTLPLALNFVSASNGGTLSAGVVSWPLFDLAASQTVTYTLITTVADPVPVGTRTILNSVNVEDDGSNGPDPTPSNNSDDDVDRLPPDLQIFKDDGGVSVRPGGNITYTLSYSNVGLIDALNAVITETVPLNTSFSAAGSAPGWSCADGAAPGTTCTFTVGFFAAGDVDATTFTVRVDNPLASGVTSITNTVLIADNGSEGADPTPPNNQGVATSPIIPTAITLLRFDATKVGDAVQLDWATGSELNTMGFRVYRSASTSFAAAKDVTGLIIAQGNGLSGAEYRWTDEGGAAASYHYWLVEIALDGTRTTYGPVSVAAQPQQGFMLYLPVVRR